jgi:hypothetical protein
MLLKIVAFKRTIRYFSKYVSGSYGRHKASPLYAYLTHFVRVNVPLRHVVTKILSLISIWPPNDHSLSVADRIYSFGALLIYILFWPGRKRIIIIIGARRSAMRKAPVIPTGTSSVALNRNSFAAAWPQCGPDFTSGKRGVSASQLWMGRWEICERF